MKKYTAEEIRLFLMAMDNFCTTSYEVILIGGSAAALAYKVIDATQDIDSWNNVNKVTEAYEKAKKTTGLNIPFGQASVSDAPYSFEERLIDYEPETFKKLKVKIPEVIDLILMKTTRGYEHDLNAIEQMVVSQNVKLEPLTERFMTEMNSVVIIGRNSLNLNFLAMIERCYGENAAAWAQAKIGYKK